MNLDELRAVQDREREKDSLQHLRDSFYEEVGTYIGDLRAERERRADQADDPFADPEVRRLTDEIETAEEVAESIYERRMGKVVKTASLAAAGYTADTDGLTGEEDDLFDDLVERIEENQATVLDVLSGSLDRSEDPTEASGSDLNLDDSETDPPFETSDPDRGDSAPSADGPASSGSEEPDSDGAEPPTPTEPVDRSTSEGGAAASGAGGSEAGAASGSSESVVASGGDSAGAGDVAASGDGDRPATEAEAIAAGEDAAGEDAPGDGLDAAAMMGDPDRITVRITDDVGEIVGVDGTAYDLVTDDVVTLPEENAMPLLEKDAATRVE